MEAFYVILLLLAREPKTQIAGVTLIADFSGMTRKHIATDLEDIKAWVNLISVGYDKKTHYLDDFFSNMSFYCRVVYHYGFIVHIFAMHPEYLRLSLTS